MPRLTQFACCPILTPFSTSTSSPSGSLLTSVRSLQRTAIRNTKTSSTRLASSLSAIWTRLPSPFTTAPPPTASQAETRYSEIFQGRFDSGRVSQYLRKLARKVESYHDLDIYIIPLEGRTVRVALLGIDIAAASNIADPGVIHGMIDRYKQSALPFAGPPLVSEYYRRVPLGSVIWTIARPPAASAAQEHGELLLPGGWSGLLPPNSVVIASARPLNDIHLRAQVLTNGEAEARSFTERVNTYLALFKSLDISMDAGGPDPDVKAAFESLEVHQDKNEAVLTAKVPYAFFKKVLSEPAVELGPETQKPPQQNAPAAKAKSPKSNSVSSRETLPV